MTDITQTTAVTGGNITNEGSTAVFSSGVCWKSSSDPTVSDSYTIERGGSGFFNSNITNLTPNTLYYVRAYAINGAGSGYGNKVTFTTSQVEVPVLTTAAMTSINQTSAVSGGTITKENGGSVTARGVCWSKSINPNISDSITSDGSGSGIYTSKLTGLIGNTTYYIRAYATNAAGTGYGDQINFNTSPVMPTLSTSPVSSITATSCIIGGNISSDGGASVTNRGVCWNTNHNPTTADSKTIDGSGTGQFISTITKLKESTTYFVRAYPVNAFGTYYGNEIFFHYFGSTSDIEGNVYKTITIGTQLWMAENLRTTHYKDNSPVAHIHSGSWPTSGAYCWFNNDPNNYYKYGALYNWHAVETGNLCPTGWLVPSDAEWTTLTDFLIINGYGYEGSGNDIAKSMAATWVWSAIDIPGFVGNDQHSNNSSGFTAIPAGHRHYNAFEGKGSHCYWWSSTSINALWAWNRAMNWQSSDVYTGQNDKYTGFSVRCLKDY